MPFQAFHPRRAPQTFKVPNGRDHLHMAPDPSFGGLWVQNVPVTPGETLTVTVGFKATGVDGGWPDGGRAGGDLPVAPVGSLHARGGNGSAKVTRADGSVLLCIGGAPGPGASVNGNARGGGMFHAPAGVPGRGDDPRIPDPDAFNIPHYVAPQFPDEGLPMIYDWQPGNPGGTARGGDGIVASNPSAGASPLATSGGGGGFGGGASGGYECLQIHTDPLGDGSGTGGSNLIVNQTYIGRPGGSVIPPSDGALPAMTGDEETMGDLLFTDAESHQPAGEPLMIAFFWPVGPANGWTVGAIGAKAGEVFASIADGLIGFA